MPCHSDSVCPCLDYCRESRCLALLEFADRRPMLALGLLFVLPVLYPVPILDFWGPYAKLCRRPGGGGGVGVEKWMKHICPCFTPSRIALAEGARETVSLRGTLSTHYFFFFQTRDCTTFTLQDFYIESVTAHRIKINNHSCFHNSWPNSKSKLKLKHL